MGKSSNENLENGPKIIGSILYQSFSLFFNQIWWLLGFCVFSIFLKMLPSLSFVFLSLKSNSIMSMGIKHILVVFFASMLIIICRDWRIKAQVSWPRAFWEVVKQFHKILGVSLLLLVYIITLLSALDHGLPLFLIPGIIIAILFSCSLPVLLIEKTTMSACLIRCSQLTKGNRLFIFGFFIIIYAIHTFSLYLILGIIDMVQLLGNIDNVQLMEYIRMFRIAFLTLPIPLIVFPITFLYYELLRKKEGEMEICQKRGQA